MIYNGRSLWQFIEEEARRSSCASAAKKRTSGFELTTTRISQATLLPIMDYTSKAEARRLFRQFANVQIDIQNVHNTPIGLHLRRELFLGNLARVIGLDLYIVADKR
jgi:hypothetical protein